MREDRPIKIFAVSTCGHCNTLKRMLGEKNISFDFVDVDLLEGKQRKDVLDEVRRLNKRCSFPTIVIGEQVIVGFREDEIREALGI